MMETDMHPEIYLGPPGTGKTTTLLNIVDEELARQTDPTRIGFFSFTVKAANEAAERAAERFKFDRKEKLPWFRTLHSMCFRVLGLRNSDMLVGEKMNEFANYVGLRVTGRAWSDDGILSGFEIGDRILFMENMARVRMVPLKSQFDEFDDNLPWKEVKRVAEALANFKKQNGLLDFTDTLSEFVKSTASISLDVLIGDEMQDFSALQWRVFEKLAKKARRVCVAGDDDQAIYRWSGADVEHMIDMDGKVRVLGQSFRCPPPVQLLSNEVIGPVKHRRAKVWRAREGGAGGIRRVNEFVDADMARDSVLVLARNNSYIQKIIEPVLRRIGVVYEMSNGKSSLNLDGLGAAETWTRLTRDKPVRLDEARQMYQFLSTNTGVKHGHKKLPSFGEIGDVLVTAAELVRDGGLRASLEKPWYDALDRIPSEDTVYMQAALRHGEKLRSKPRVRVSTIHSAKGGEADHVVLMTDMALRTHDEMARNPDDERRVWYVGVTRARDRLTLVDPDRSGRYCPWL
jgi:DNA helicase-2/ATP-dependent DNA helicase PcrA